MRSTLNSRFFQKFTSRWILSREFISSSMIIKNSQYLENIVDEQMAAKEAHCGRTAFLTFLSR